MSDQTHTPCPFCGHLNARLRVRLAAGSYSASCGACLAEGPAAATAAEAEAAWDRRTGPAGDALLAACEAALPDVEYRLDCERSAVDNMSPELVRLYDLQGKLARAIAEATGAWPRHRKE